MFVPGGRCILQQQGWRREHSKPKWRNGRRAGLKIRSSQEGVGSSPTFGSNDLQQIPELSFGPDHP